MSITQDDKRGVVLITGTAGSLGKAVARRFTQDAASSPDALPVVGLDLGYEHEEILVDAELENFCTRRLDATDPDHVRAVFEEVREAFGPVRAMVHCAGGFRWSHLDTISDADISFLLDVNLRSSFYMVREALADLKREGRGHIVLISSKSTLSPGEGEGVYAATKAGLNAIVQSVAREIASLDCTINAVLPSILDTPPNREEMPDADFDTWVKLDDLAHIIHTFTSPIGAPINGALLPVTART